MSNKENISTIARPMVGNGPNHMSRFNTKKEKLENPKETVKRLLGYLGSKKKRLISILLLSLITAVIGIVGTRLNGYVIDEFIDKGNMAGLIKICGILGFIYIVNVVSIFFQNRLMVGVAQTSTLDIRKDLFKNLQGLPLKYFDTHSSGDLMSRLTNDIDNINMTLSQSIVQFFSGIITIVGMLIAMLILSPVLTIVGLITTPIMLFITKLIVKRTQPFFVKQQKELGALNGYIEEMISGQKAVLLFSKEEAIKKEFLNINSRLSKSSIFAQGLSGFMGPVNNFINNLTYLIIAVLGGYLVLNDTGITVGVVFTFILYMRNFTRPINEILNLFNTIQSALAGAERVFQVIDETKEEDDTKAEELNDIKGDVSLKEVKFSYIEDREILKGISLEAKQGQTIAIVGPTGSGKTTIINLLTKFYDVDSGQIMIDGQNISNITRKSLRQSISMVLQDTYLFSETVRENIRYGRLTASDEEVVKAAQLAHADRFIKQLPKGYDTVLADNGSNLSHGQRQLLAIARAILAESSILILDEATSSIDTRTEVYIQKAMLNLMKEKTTFVIAHRLSTIRNADNIIAIKDGKIEENGTHDELIEKNGFYANLYNSQFKKGIDI